MPLYLLPLLPLIGFALLICLPQVFKGKTGGFVGAGAVLAAFVVALIRFFDLGSHGGQAHEVLWQWLPSMALDGKGQTVNLSIGFWLDNLSGMMTLIITGIGFLIHLYSISYMSHDAKMTRFFAFLNFFVAMMLILVLADSYPLMFVGWEGVGMASFLLIGFWHSGRNAEAEDEEGRQASTQEGINNSNAARKAFIMNRIGDLGFMLGMFLLYKLYGTLNIPQLAELSANTQVVHAGIEVACLFLLVGAVGKSGQLPLTTWLPDAMAGPTPVSALIHAATMVTAGVYLIARSHFLFDGTNAALWVAWIGGLTALYGALSALNQHDIKKILAFSTVSQLGYMFLAVGVGAYAAGAFHLLTHAFFKALLFLAAGAVIHALHEEQDVRKMGGMRRFMPFTHIVSLIGVLAISGVPIFSGFFSKDAILAATYEQSIVLYGIGLFVALLTAFYMGRWYFLVWTGEYRGETKNPHEADIFMQIPLGILALLAALGGLLNIPKFIGETIGVPKEFIATFDHFLDPVVGHLKHHPSAETEWLLTAFAVGAGLLGLLAAFMMHKSGRLHRGPLGGLSNNALYLDAIYDNLVAAPSRGIAAGLDGLDKEVDGAMSGIAKNASSGGVLFARLQNGFVRGYAVSILLGTVLILGYWVVQLIGGL